MWQQPKEFELFEKFGKHAKTAGKKKINKGYFNPLNFN